MIRVEGRVGPALGWCGAGEAFEDKAAAHGDDGGCAEIAVAETVGCWEIWSLGEQVQSGDEGNEVAVVDAGIISHSTKKRDTRAYETYKLKNNGPASSGHSARRFAVAFSHSHPIVAP